VSFEFVSDVMTYLRLPHPSPSAAYLMNLYRYVVFAAQAGDGYDVGTGVGTGVGTAVGTWAYAVP